MESWHKIVIGAVLTTLVWVIATFLTPPTDDATLRKFYRLIKPAGSGWDAVLNKAREDGDPIDKEYGQLPLEILCVVIGCFTVFGILFATGIA